MPGVSGSISSRSMIFVRVLGSLSRYLKFVCGRGEALGRRVKTLAMFLLFLEIRRASGIDGMVTAEGRL